MTAPQEHPAVNPVESIGKIVALISAIVGVTISANTLLSSCSKERADNYAAFRTAVSSEEKSWQDLYDNYLKTFEKEQFDNAELRKRKLFAFQAIAVREIASFAEFDVADAEREAARKRIGLTRDALLSSLADNATSDAQTAAALRQRTFTAERAATEAAGVSTTPSPGASETPAPASQTLAKETGAGWAVDVFWCDGAMAERNQTAAAALANAFASFSRANRPLAPGIQLGRVRVLKADAETWRRVGLAPGFYVVMDGGPGERAAAEATQRLVNGSLAPGAARYGLGLSRGTPTPWYISVWVCAPQPGTPLQPLQAPPLRALTS